jgi:hypothetical protein
MTPEDRQEFKFDIREIDWKEMIEVFSYGLRRYYLK